MISKQKRPRYIRMLPIHPSKSSVEHVAQSNLLSLSVHGIQRQTFVTALAEFLVDFKECNVTSSHWVLLHKKGNPAGDCGSSPCAFLAKVERDFLGTDVVHDV